MKKLTIAMVGFGKSTMRYHLPYILKREHLSVKWIYNRSQKSELEKNYAHTNIKFTTNLDEVLSDAEVDLVCIITAPESHYALAKQCLGAGKHVLVEKPFTETLEEAKELVALAKANGVLVMPFQNRRFDGDFLALKKVLETGYLGQLIEIESHYDYFRPTDVVSEGALVNSFVYGHAVHLVDRFVGLFGRPKQVFYDIKNVRTGKGLDDYHDIHLFYEGFKCIVKSSSLVKMPYPQFFAHGSKGSFIKYGIDTQEYDLKAGIMPEADGFGVDNTYNHGKLNYLNQNGDTIEREVVTPLGDYGRIYDNLYEAIVHGKSKLISDEQILTVIEILSRAYDQQGPHVAQF